MLSDFSLNLLRLQYELGSLLKLLPLNVINLDRNNRCKWKLEVKTTFDLKLTRLNLGSLFGLQAFVLFYVLTLVFRDGATSVDIITVIFAATLLTYTVITLGFNYFYFKDISSAVNEMISLSNRGNVI